MRIVYTGGGTLGSVTPLLAVAEQDGAIERLWIGTSSGPEKKFIEDQQIPFIPIEAFRLRRFFSIRNIIELPHLITSYVNAKSILKKFYPDIVLTAGSFTGVPVCLAAHRLGIPFIVLQLDVVPGLANKLLFSRATRIIVPHQSFKKEIPHASVTVCGIPISNMYQQTVIEKKTITFLGGGTGSLWLNNFVVNNLQTLLSESDVIHFQGDSKRAALMSGTHTGYVSIFHANRKATIQAIHRSNIIVTRGGMGTLAELSEFKKPTIIVPMPSSHQEQNALFFSSQGAAIKINQSQGEEVLLDQILGLLHDTERQKKLSKHIYELLPHDASRCAQNVIRSVLV